MTELHKQSQFAAIRAGVATPEEINDRPEFAPSKRIEMLFPAIGKPFTAPRLPFASVSIKSGPNVRTFADG
jgi:hypothetical protein